MERCRTLSSLLNVDVLRFPTYDAIVAVLLSVVVEGLAALLFKSKLMYNYFVVVVVASAGVVVYLAISILQLIGQPIESLVESIAAGCTRRLNVPVTVSE